jgi:serine protease Do
MRNLYLAFLFLMGCAGRAAPATPAKDSSTGLPFARAQLTEAAAPHPETQPMASRKDDAERMSKMLSEGAQLLKAGAATKAKTLIEQLARTRCRVKLIAPPRKVLASEDLYERMKPSVVVIGTLYKCDRCDKIHLATASGVVISESGVCATNYHVVNNPRNEALVIMTDDSRVLPVKAVLAADKFDDVALLQVDAKGLKPAALVPDAKVGSHIYVLSHPDRCFYTFSEGVISRYFTLHQPSGVDTLEMSITADYAKGSSGAPIFNDRGAVVGLARSTSPVYYDDKDGKKGSLQMVVKQCVPASRILKLIEK